MEWSRVGRGILVTSRDNTGRTSMLSLLGELLDRWAFTPRMPIVVRLTTAAYFV